MSLWDYKEAFDEVIFCIENSKNKLFACYLKLKFFKKARHFHCFNLLKGKSLAQVIANGPSAKNYKINSSAQQIYMNFGFKHPTFAEAKDPVLCIVDEKLVNGGWPIEMIHEAYKINETVIFAFSIFFISSRHIRELTKNYDIFFTSNFLTATRWSSRPLFSINKPSYGGGATEQSLSLAVSLFYKHIDVYGYDGNNVILGLNATNTHFYGVDPSKDWSNPKFVARELRFLSYFIDKNVHLARLMSARGVSVRLSDPSVFMTMFRSN
ncbi:hypothetical protein OAM78_04060 [Alphaproteobacteria bacterium]|nr:hypothetical protein [Alphaproteobacteria bacterium]